MEGHSHCAQLGLAYPHLQEYEDATLEKWAALGLITSSLREIAGIGLDGEVMVSPYTGIPVSELDARSLTKKEEIPTRRGHIRSRELCTDAQKKI